MNRILPSDIGRRRQVNRDRVDVAVAPVARHGLSAERGSTGGGPRTAGELRVDLAEDGYRALGCGPAARVVQRAPVAVVDTDIVDQHLVVGVPVTVHEGCRDGTTHVSADRDIHDQVHRMVERPRVVLRARGLGIGQVCVVNVTVDTDLNRVRGPPDLVGVPLRDRAVEIVLGRELRAAVGWLLRGGSLEVQGAGDFIVLVAVGRRPLHEVDLPGIGPGTLRCHIAQQPYRGPGTRLGRQLGPHLVISVGADLIDVGLNPGRGDHVACLGGDDPQRAVNVVVDPVGVGLGRVPGDQVNDLDIVEVVLVNLDLVVAPAFPGGGPGSAVAKIVGPVLCVRFLADLVKIVLKLEREPGRYGVVIR